MEFLQGKLYKKYYPIKNILIFYDMSEREFNTLIKWVKIIENDVFVYNFEKEKQAMRTGSNLCRQVIINYPKSIKDLYLLLKNKKLSSLDEDDLEFINDILYRHKYNCIISAFVFPTKKKKTNIGR